MRFIPFAAAPTLVSRRGKSNNRACARIRAQAVRITPLKGAAMKSFVSIRIATKRQGGVQIALKRRPDFLLLA
jgi:hypothetical protein